MKRPVDRLWWQRILLTLIIVNSQLSMVVTRAQQFADYDADHPAVVVCNWDFPPYEFNNDNGKPDGFNIQLLSTIMKQLKIPCQFVMKDWTQAQEMFEHHEADLMIDPLFKYHGRPYILSRNILNYYKVKVVSLPETEPILALDKLLPEDTIVLKKDDYSTGRIVDERQLNVSVEYHSPKEALKGIAHGRFRYFIWGEYPLKWKMKNMALDSLSLSDIDIPDGEMRIVGYDKELIDLIDDEYARLEQSGELEAIHDVWFHPERVHNDTSPIALFVLAGIIIASVIAFLMSRLIRVRVKLAVRKSNDINYMMTQAVDKGDLRVLEYDLHNNLVKNIYGHLLPEEGMTPEQLSHYIHPEDLPRFSAGFHDIVTGKRAIAHNLVRWNTGTAESPRWTYFQGNANVETENGKVRYAVCSLRDITKEVEEGRNSQELANRYLKVFQTNLVAMSFYGKDGRLIDLNENMRILCGFTEESEAFFRDTSMFDIPLFSQDFDRESRDDHHVCQHMYYPDIHIDKYIEYRISPTCNDQGELVYYIVTARDVTAERTMYLEQRAHDRQLQQVNKATNQYEEQLRYLLEKSDMYVWNYSISEKLIQFSRSLRQSEFAETLDEYFETLTEEQHEIAKGIISECVLKGKPFNIIHRFEKTPVSNQPRWYTISGIATHDKEGKPTGCFGIVRDITTLMDAQARLKEETARAEDSGRLKAAFLANMTHEIRTPLNAIVGFSDLLPLIDVPEERMEFIRIIRNNCDMLMRLINDILEASTMGQALAIEPAEVDFARVFDDICQTLAQRVQEPGVEFQKDNPYEHYVTTLDKGRIQQVLTNFTTNAVKYTHEGHIRVGYRQERRITRDGAGEANGLYFYCEDTGAGIPKEKQASVFERFVKLNDFVQGTGLGLSICQGIADRCNGHIGVTSEGPGHGSTFWLWIPCEQIVNT